MNVQWSIQMSSLVMSTVMKSQPCLSYLPFDDSSHSHSSSKRRLRMIRLWARLTLKFACRMVAPFAEEDGEPVLVLDVDEAHAAGQQHRMQERRGGGAQRARARRGRDLVEAEVEVVHDLDHLGAVVAERGHEVGGAVDLPVVGIRVREQAAAGRRAREAGQVVDRRGQGIGHGEDGAAGSASSLRDC